jgi:hypothetical protein
MDGLMKNKRHMAAQMGLLKIGKSWARRERADWKYTEGQGTVAMYHALAEAEGRMQELRDRLMADLLGRGQ